MATRKLRTTQAAKRADVHPRTIRRWAERGWIKAHRTAGGHLRIDADSLAMFHSEQSGTNGGKADK